MYSWHIANCIIFASLSAILIEVHNKNGTLYIYMYIYKQRFSNTTRKILFIRLYFDNLEISVVFTSAEIIARNRFSSLRA